MNEPTAMAASVLAAQTGVKTASPDVDARPVASSLDVHFHTLVLDGIFAEGEEETLRFQKVESHPHGGPEARARCC